MLTQKLFPDATLVVCESQAADYEHYGLEIVKIPDDRTGISMVHNWIVQHFPEDVKILLCDDLISCKGLTARKPWTLKVEDIDLMTRTTAACAIGAGARLFGWNQQANPRMALRNDPFPIHHWVGGGIGYVGSKPGWDERLKCKCDIDACLNGFLTERIVWQDSRFSFVQSRDKKLGGNSVFKTERRVAVERKYLKSKWGPHIFFETYKSQDRVGIDVERRQKVDE